MRKNQSTMYTVDAELSFKGLELNWVDTDRFGIDSSVLYVTQPSLDITGIIIA